MYLSSDIPVCFIQYFFDIGILVKKYEKSSAIPSDMCTKPCLVTITHQSTKCTTWLKVYPYSDTKHHKIMKLH